MSNEEKAKAYDEALKRAEAVIKVSQNQKEVYGCITTIFPELAESEGERIRKELKHYLEVRRCQTQSDEEYINCNNFLDWLEKQGEQKPILDFKAKDWYVSKVDGKIHNIYHSVDKVEPKFKVGDWIINRTDATIMQIVNNKDFYESVETGGQRRTDTYNYVEWDFRLWTIQDAKDGDVLYSPEHKVLWIYKNKEECHAAINLNYANFTSFGADIEIPSDVCPATKEQRDLLFQKMKEAGHEWDEEWGDKPWGKDCVEYTRTDTLEVKEVDLMKELSNYIESYRRKETGYTIFGIAEHFFELGLKTRKENKS